MSPVWQEHLRVPFYDAEPSGRASVPAVCRYLQEAANGHTLSIGMSARQVRESNRMWVLSRMHVHLSALPQAGAGIVVETWAPERLGGIRAYRDFRLRDSDRNILCEASSLWLLLDATTRRPVRLPEAVLRMRHPECVGHEPVDAIPLAPPQASRGGEKFQVRWGDLDENGHANNVRYIEWALDSVPICLRRQARVNRLDIQFTSEVLLGEELVSACEEAGACDSRSFRHSLRAGDDRLLAVARTDWISE